MLTFSSNILMDALVDNIYYDQLTSRYRYKASNEPGTPIRGTFVSRDTVISLQVAYKEKVVKEFLELAPRIKTGEIGVYKDAATLLKKIHLSDAIIAANGIDNITSSDMGKIGAILKKQYYAGKGENGKPFGLKHLFKEVVDGNISDTRLLQRLKMYALSGELSGNIIRTSKAREGGNDEEKRLLGDAEHCDSCINYAQLGWQPIGTLPEPKTQCECLTNCKCTKVYRKSYEAKYV